MTQLSFKLGVDTNDNVCNFFVIFVTVVLEKNTSNREVDGIKELCNCIIYWKWVSYKKTKTTMSIAVTTKQQRRTKENKNEPRERGRFCPILFSSPFPL